MFIITNASVLTFQFFPRPVAARHAVMHCLNSESTQNFIHSVVVGHGYAYGYKPPIRHFPLKMTVKARDSDSHSHSDTDCTDSDSSTTRFSTSDTE